MKNNNYSIDAIGWVLPSSIGTGKEILTESNWLDNDFLQSDSLQNFSAKPYLNSIKGYLDPSSAYTLSATTLALQSLADEAINPICDSKTGVAVATQYGACQTAYKFFAQFVAKGARFASPLLFPHSYPNTASNLVAIEFGFAGPHLTLSPSLDVREVLQFAFSQLDKNSAEQMLVGAYEAMIPTAVPNNTQCLNGAIMLRINKTVTKKTILTIENKLPEIDHGFGNVYALLLLLQKLKQIQGE